MRIAAKMHWIVASGRKIAARISYPDISVWFLLQIPFINFFPHNAPLAQPTDKLTGQNNLPNIKSCFIEVPTALKASLTHKQACHNLTTQLRG